MLPVLRPRMPPPELAVHAASAVDRCCIGYRVFRSAQSSATARLRGLSKPRRLPARPTAVDCPLVI